MKGSIVVLFLLLFFTSVFNVEAQPNKGKRLDLRNKMPGRSKYFSWGFGVGINNYFGDIVPNGGSALPQFNSDNLYVGTTFEYRFHPLFSARAGLSYTKISGSDAKVDQSTDENSANTYLRNLSFRNNMIEFSTMFTANIFPVARGYLNRPLLNPFVFLGINVFTNNPQANEYEKGGNGEWINLRKLKTEGQGTNGAAKIYSPVQIGIPLGLGLKVSLTRKIDVSLEFAYHYTFTNSLDDIGTTYLDETLYETADPLTVRMSNRSGEKIDNFGNVRTIGGVPITQLIGTPLFKTVTLSDGSNFTYHVNTVKGGNPRGGASPDFWLTSAIHIHYIIGRSKGKPKR